MLFFFPINLIVYSTKMVHENYRCSRSITSQEKRTDWILRNSLVMKKINNISLKFWHFSFFDSQSDQGITQLVIKPFGISQALRIVSLR